MRAAIIRRYGGPEQLKVETVPNPKPRADEVIVKVRASSVNPIDWKIRNGSLRFLFGHRFPKILGFDLSGEVVACGGAVSKFSPGDSVYARSDRRTGEAYAELVAVSERALARKPDSLNFKQAAAVPLAGLTALQALRDKGGLRSGQRLMVLGASGGVGTFAVQIGKALGAWVTGVCGTANLDLVKSLGADETIDYTKQSVDQLKGPFEVVFDAVGLYGFMRVRSLLTPSGVYVSTLPGPGLIFAQLVGNFLFRRKGRFIWVDPLGADLDDLSELAQTGRLRAVVDSEFDLSEIAAAHERSETGRSRGKIVVQIG